MKNLEGKFEKWKKVRMAEDKKRSLRTELISYMAENPIAEAVPAQFFMPLRYFAPLAFAALLIFVGGGTSLAAEKAIPGDPLYPVKIDFNEKIIGMIEGVSPSLSASWQARLTERRLEEADQLALSGKLTDANQADISARFESSAKNAEKSIAALSSDGKSSDAQDISADLESSLEAHAKILAELSPKPENTPKEAPRVMSLGITSTGPASASATAESSVASETPHDKIRAKINEVLDSLAKTRDKAENKVVSEDKSPEAKTAAEGKIKSAENVAESVDIFLSERSDEFGKEALADAKARMDKVHSMISDAKAKADSGAYGEAFVLSGQAMRKAQETRILADAQLQADSGRSASSSARGASLNFLKSTGGDDESSSSAIIDATGNDGVSSTEPAGGAAKPLPNVQLNVSGESKAE